MLLKCEDCMVTFESESLKDCPSCGTTEFIYQLSGNQVLAYENQKLKKQLATAVEALDFASKDFVRVNGVKEGTKISKKAKQALAEIGVPVC